MDALRFVSLIESCILFLLLFFQNRHLCCSFSRPLFAIKDHSSGIWVVLAYAFHCVKSSFIQFINFLFKQIIMANVLVHALIGTFHHSFDLFQVVSSHHGLNLIQVFHHVFHVVLHLVYIVYQLILFIFVFFLLHLIFLLLLLLPARNSSTSYESIFACINIEKNFSRFVSHGFCLQLQ